MRPAAILSKAFRHARSLCSPKVRQVRSLPAKSPTTLANPAGARSVRTSSNSDLSYIRPPRPSCRCIVKRSVMVEDGALAGVGPSASVKQVRDVGRRNSCGSRSVLGCGRPWVPRQGTRTRWTYLLSRRGKLGSFIPICGLHWTQGGSPEYHRIF